MTTFIHAAPLTLRNSICYCNNSFYWNGITCSACYSSCQVCNGCLLTDCLLKTVSGGTNNACNTGYFYYSNTCESNVYQNCLLVILLVLIVQVKILMTALFAFNMQVFSQTTPVHVTKADQGLLLFAIQSIFSFFISQCKRYC